MTSPAIIRVFLSSPSDVMYERKCVQEIAKEVNESIGFSVHRIIEIVGWENTVPSISTYAQEVINNTIDSYDVFLGILGARFGTPTPKAGSGTEEEFDIAYEKYQQSQIKDICMFFKVDGIPLDDIDAEQLNLVNNFKKKISDIGCYRTDFRPQNFEIEIRKLFSRLILKWDDIKISNSIKDKTIHRVIESHMDEDIGFYDAIFTAIEEIESSNAIFDVLKSSTLKFNNAMMIMNTRLKAIVSDNERMNVINLFSEEMQEFDHCLLHNSNKQKNHLEKSLKFLDIANELYLADFVVSHIDLVKCRDALFGYSKTLENGTMAATNIKEVIEKFPRATTKLNRSKKSLVQTYDRHIKNNFECLQLIENMILKMDKFLP